MNLRTLKSLTISIKAFLFGVKNMEQKILIVYNPVTRELEIKENDFTTFEALGILEASKAMIQNDWLKEE
jgi:hypothetical protein